MVTIEAKMFFVPQVLVPSSSELITFAKDYTIIDATVMQISTGPLQFPQLFAVRVRMCQRQPLWEQT